MGLGDFFGSIYIYIGTTISDGVSSLLLLFFFSVSVPKPLTDGRDGRISCRVIYNVFEITTGSTGNQFSPRARMQLAADAQLVINTLHAAVQVPSSHYAAYIIIAADEFLFPNIIIIDTHCVLSTSSFSRRARDRRPPTG